MCVLCMFYLDWELGGRKKLIRVGLQETNNFFLGPILLYDIQISDDIRQTFFLHGEISIWHHYSTRYKI